MCILCIGTQKDRNNILLPFRFIACKKKNYLRETNTFFATLRIGKITLNKPHPITGIFRHDFRSRAFENMYANPHHFTVCRFRGKIMLSRNNSRIRTAAVSATAVNTTAAGQVSNGSSEKTNRFADVPCSRQYGIRN